MPSSSERDPQAYQAGEMVPVSGIYLVVHHEHRPNHEAIAIQGEEFPTCRICKSQVRFHLSQAVPHMTHDFDLAGPALPGRKGRAKAASKGTD